MTRLAVVIIAAALVATPVQAGWQESLAEAWAVAHRYLYPPRPAAVVPMPVSRPEAAPSPKVEAPPVAAPTVKKQVRKPAKERKAAKKPKARPTADEGPDLPYPCWMVRMKAAGKTSAQLDQISRESGVTLTPKQRRQARACLAVKP